MVFVIEEYTGISTDYTTLTLILRVGEILFPVKHFKVVFFYKGI